MLRLPIAAIALPLCLLPTMPCAAPTTQTLPYAIVDTGQIRCYDSQTGIAPPAAGQPFHGQDCQQRRFPPTYAVSADGLTVYDRHTGLTWQRSPDTNGDGSIDRRDKMTLAQAEAHAAALNAQRFGGHSDWRLPTVKELYSLILFSGIDPSGPNLDSSQMKPFIDTNIFAFAYGDTQRGERPIDAQYLSSTRYTGRSVRNLGKQFGVNFADGRIKGYDLAGPGGSEKTFYVQLVRGNPAYGRNDLRDNGNGTVTDRATGLMWARQDSGRSMNWQEALAWAQEMNAAGHLGHRDWRLPSAKELQSLVDYTRSPDGSGTAAISPLLECTRITNEIGEADYPGYWSATTHANLQGGGSAVYVSFGRSAGWMMPPGASVRHFVDVHGAGAQRSDPKLGNPAAFPYGRGPQGDVIRIYNFVRLVRSAE